MNSASGRRHPDQGRYLAQVAGCNDCHTSDYLMSGGKVPVSEWLKGDNFGWRGPWGTTYAPNLCLFMQGMSEDEWVKIARELKRRPPMPWYTVNMMHENDLRALHRFIVSLGDPGQPAPAFVPPGEEPKTPYALFPSPPEKKQILIAILLQPSTSMRRHSRRFEPHPEVP